MLFRSEAFRMVVYRYKQLKALPLAAVFRIMELFGVNIKSIDDSHIFFSPFQSVDSGIVTTCRMNHHPYCISFSVILISTVK